MNINFYKRTIVGTLKGPLIWAVTWHGGKRSSIIVSNLLEVDELYNLSGRN